MGAPSFPDPTATSKTALQFGKKAGQYTKELGFTNQKTPFGTLSYAQTGTNPDGTPKYTATTRFSGPYGRIFRNMAQAQNTGLGTATDILGVARSDLAAGPDLGPTADETGITKAITGWGHDYLQPIFDAQQKTLDAKLANQGIAPGSAAYTAANMDQSRNVNDAYTKLLLSGQDTALQAQQQNQQRGALQYQLPINAYTSLMTGQQQPQLSFAQTPTGGGVAAPDYAGLVGSKYQADAANNPLNGLFKAGSAVLGGWASGGL